MNDKKKKRYEKPEADVLDFSNDDIIALSSTDQNNKWWNDDDNTEDWA